jgi:hypothetical protein
MAPGSIMTVGGKWTGVLNAQECSTNVNVQVFFQLDPNGGADITVGVTFPTPFFGFYYDIFGGYGSTVVPCSGVAYSVPYRSIQWTTCHVPLQCGPNFYDVRINFLLGTYSGKSPSATQEVAGSYYYGC